MSAERRPSVEITVISHDNESLANARVLLRPPETRKGEPIRLGYDRRLGSYSASEVPEGSYILTVSARGYEPDEREVEVSSGGLREAFVLGREGMPFYYRGRTKVPFEPPRNLFGVSLQPGRSEQEEKDFLAYAARLNVTEEPEVPEAVLQDNVRLFRFPPRARSRMRQQILAEITEHPVAQVAGLLIHLGEETVTFLTNQLIVRFKSHVTVEEIPQIARQYDLTMVRAIPYAGNAYLFKQDEMGSFKLLEICDRFVQSGLVEYAEPNLVITAVDLQINPTDFLYPEQWHIPLVSLPTAWQTLRNENPAGVNPGDPGDLSFGSENVILAVMDRGIQSNTVGGVTVASHPDFAGTVTGGGNKVAQFYDFANMVPDNNAPPNDHGMGCAGVAGALANNPSTVAGFNEGVVGAAPNCQLMGLIRPAGGGEQRYADAFVWTAGFNPGWTIDGVNYFLGTVFPAAPVSPADIITNSFSWGAWPISGLMQDALDFVTTYGRSGRGVAMFFAAGNGNTAFTAQAGLAAHPKTMAVAASTLANDGVTEVRAAYSNFGNGIDFCAPSHDQYVGGQIVHNPPANYGVISADLLNGGNMPGRPTQQTTLSAPLAVGGTTLNVVSSAGFVVGQAALLGAPGAVGTEAQMIVNIPNATQITITASLNAHPTGTLLSGGPADYKNNFGGTSSATPLSAGIAALVLSIDPELSWLEVRDILRTTADRIDLTNTNAVGQWVDTDGDGVVDYSQWYGYGRLNANDAIQAARDYDHDRDIVVRDNLDDDGSVPSGGWHAHSPDIWVRAADDPIPVLAYTAAPPHQNPIRGQDNYVYLRVKNIGTDVSGQAWLRALITHYPGFEFRYPQEWQPTNPPGTAVPSPLTPGTYLIGESLINNLAAGDDTIVKMTWDSALVPPDTVTVGGVAVKWHPCLLAEVSPHDGPPPGGATFDVKRDNNLAHRNIRIDDPADTDDDLAVGVVAGTSDIFGVEAVVLDRSFLPFDYRVFVRVADEAHMRNWLSLLEEGKLIGAAPLPGSPVEEPEPRPLRPGRPIDVGRCQVTLLDPGRLGIACCEDDAIVIHASAHTRIEFLCAESRGPSGRPKLSRGKAQGQDVIFFDGGSAGLELPLRLAPSQYVPVIIGLSRTGGRRGVGLLKATQRRGDGELSPGYSIEG
jgi:hypothetical protein